MESTVYAGENVKENRAPEREKQIQTWVGTIHKHVKESSNIQDELSSRLSMICQNHDVPKSDTEEVHQELVPLASELRGIASMIQAINDTYRRIIESLEI